MAFEDPSVHDIINITVNERSLGRIWVVLKLHQFSSFTRDHNEHAVLSLFFRDPENADRFAAAIAGIEWAPFVEAPLPALDKENADEINF